MKATNKMRVTNANSQSWFNINDSRVAVSQLHALRLKNGAVIKDAEKSRQISELLSEDEVVGRNKKNLLLSPAVQ